ncbi:precorrin-6A synthase (deacetylating) [Pontibaca methylaminivorans]|uniref:Precorrin-6A synthase [deacetylating] n=1 Tax=Pontibaca methylaminivorans TaxID=515897 RepID=A0A1R3WC03_9RHOB|nr:precorrin-6A synthase (deacetylating) [Pontibaca methylaminivorans]SIT75577.1 precorrin-6A synthase (deacetylating) [Pontibaca methylaminivorans]
MDILLIGIGTGNPEHLTLQAIRAMKRADLVLIPRKGDDKADLSALRRAICLEVLGDDSRIAEFDMPVRDPANPSYLSRVSDWHDAIAARWADAIATRPQAEVVALLVWGDPALYDSSLRIAARLAGEVTVSVVPGLMSPQVLTAAHGIALNDIGAPFLVTTGRRLRNEGWPGGVDTLVVMLDGDCSFAALDPEGVTIWWGAYVGMENQILDHGPLAEAGPRIRERREAARAAHGWIMDIYLLRRSR